MNARGLGGIGLLKGEFGLVRVSVGQENEDVANVTSVARVFSETLFAHFPVIKIYNQCNHITYNHKIPKGQSL